MVRKVEPELQVERSRICRGLVRFEDASGFSLYSMDENRFLRLLVCKKKHD